jgi:two-component system, LytTR family, response regulator
MKTINCAIIEDEPLGAKTLESMLKKYQPQLTVTHFGQSLAQAKEILTNPEIALVFADIELLDGNLFDLLNGMKLEENKHLIFTTAYEEFGAKAFNYPAVHYLLKPINPLELDKAINRYKNVVPGLSVKETEKPQDERIHEIELEKLSIPTQNGMLFVDFDNVIRIQSSNKYSIVFTKEGRQHIVPKSLSRFEEVLSKRRFIRVHDSHIVNINHLNGYLKGKGGEIIMSDGTHVPVSIRKKDALSSIFRNPLL